MSLTAWRGLALSCTDTMCVIQFCVSCAVSRESRKLPRYRPFTICRHKQRSNKL